ncbi:MAG: ABC-2 family transporter protein [Patescibacteria group bacterium]
MLKDIRYFVIQTKFNIKNAYALRSAFWIGVVSMIVNNCVFFIIWSLFMKSVGDINGWTGVDVFGMLGVSMFIYGITFGFFHGVVDLPQMIVRGSFDNVLISPVNSFFKLATSSFLVTAYGDLLLGAVVFLSYGIYLQFSLYTWLLYVLAISFGAIVFLCIRLLCSLISFFIYDGDNISNQLFEIFLRPGLYPGAIFPIKLKTFFMTLVPALLTSAIPVDIIKTNSLKLLSLSLLVTSIWILITFLVYKIALRRYESGNLLR